MNIREQQENPHIDPAFQQEKRREQDKNHIHTHCTTFAAALL
jgi:hypothetical protein